MVELGPLAPFKICESELDLGEEKYCCGHWDPHPDDFHEAFFPNFVIEWDDEGRYVHRYRGVLR